MDIYLSVCVYISTAKQIFTWIIPKYAKHTTQVEYTKSYKKHMYEDTNRGLES